MAQVATVKSAVPLTEEEREALRRKLAPHFGDDIELTCQVDPRILGGVIVRVGDRVIDGSVAGKLEALKKSLLPGR